MTHLGRLRRGLLLGGALLVLLYTGLLISVASPPDASQVIILPAGLRYIGDAGIVLLAASQLVAVAARRGWRRVLPLLALPPLVLSAALATHGTSLATGRVEADRVTLPDGRTVMLTREPVPTDVAFAVWERADGLHWRPLFTQAADITYSEDGSFTADPRLVVSRDGRHLLLRRGGIWTDCWTIEARPRLCPLGEGEAPSGPDDWRSRSLRIAAATGADPAAP